MAEAVMQEYAARAPVTYGPEGPEEDEGYEEGWHDEEGEYDEDYYGGTWGYKGKGKKGKQSEYSIEFKHIADRIISQNPDIAVTPLWKSYSYIEGRKSEFDEDISKNRDDKWRVGTI